MIRNGYHGKFNNKIYPITISNNTVYVLSNDEDDFNNGFIKNSNYTENNSYLYRYYLSVCIEDIEWFCSIRTYGYYKGFKVWLAGEDKSEYSIMTGIIPLGNEIFTPNNGFKQYDRQIYVGNVPVSEITGIYETKSRINEEYKAPDNWDF